VGDRRVSFIERCATLEHVAIGEGAFAPGPAVWVGKREIAHFDDELTLDIRLTRSRIRDLRPELAADDRVRLRSGASDWIEVRITHDQDADFAMNLIGDAIAANLPTAPPRLPPSGADLQRRRRFH
jgi:hypothetical protein